MCFGRQSLETGRFSVAGEWRAMIWIWYRRRRDRGNINATLMAWVVIAWKKREGVRDEGEQNISSDRCIVKLVSNGQIASTGSWNIDQSNTQQTSSSLVVFQWGPTPSSEVCTCTWRHAKIWRNKKKKHRLERWFSAVWFWTGLSRTHSESMCMREKKESRRIDQS